MYALRHLKHDQDEYKKYVRLTRSHTTRCELTGISLVGLRKLGERLEVDRIDPTLGYVVGNMRTIAGSLNRAKGFSMVVPRWAITRLNRKWITRKKDILSK